MRRLSAESKVTLIYKIMRDNISSGLWKQGDQYSSFEIAKKYGIGRTSVNDAVKLLQKKGFVTILPNVGFRIKVIGRETIEEYREVRLSLEEILTEHLIQRSDTLPFEKLENHLELIEASYAMGQQEVALQALENYHAALSEVLEERYVIQILWETEDLHYYLMFQLMLHHPETFGLVMQGKKQYLRALKAQDEARAKQILRDKMEATVCCMRKLTQAKEEGREKDL